MKEPELIVSGLTFLVPAWVAWTGGQWVSTVALLTLTATSTVWHTIHQEWVRPFDIAAMVVVVILEFYNSVLAGVDGIVLGLLACLYGFIAYYWGYVDSTFCFGQSYAQQMRFHAILHVVVATVFTLNLLKIQENEKSSSHSNRLS